VTVCPFSWYETGLGGFFDSFETGMV
jgi:hypothetical protein